MPQPFPPLPDLQPGAAFPSAEPTAADAPAPAGTPPAQISVIGAGLAGWLVALALARRGGAVTVFGSFEASATALSYGGLLGRPAAQAWQQLEQRHGPLGWTPARLALHGWPAPLDRLPPSLQGLASWVVPCSRLSIPTLVAALPAVARRGGIAWRPEAVLALERQGSGWLLRLDDGAGFNTAAGAAAPAGGPAAWQRGPGGPAAFTGASGASEPAASERTGPSSGSDTPVAPTVPTREPAASPSEVWRADQVVLAAGAGCRRLWPQLDPRLRCSWAGALRLDDLPEGGSAWLEPLRHGALVLPRRWRRPALEARAHLLKQPEWIVDAGLVPSGAGALLGQISLVRPQSDPGAAPDPGWMEERLRGGLAKLDPALAALPGRYRQVAVPFCVDGQPLLGPVDDAPGLWICTGFSAPFGSLPRQAEALAAAVLASLA